MKNRTTPDIILTAFGESKSLEDWEKDSRVTIRVSTMLSRLKSGWKVEEVLLAPKHVSKIIKYKLTAFNETKSVKDWARDPRASVSYETIYKRIKLGWNAQEAICTPRQPSNVAKLAAAGEKK